VRLSALRYQPYIWVYALDQKMNSLLSRRCQQLFQPEQLLVRTRANRDSTVPAPPAGNTLFMFLSREIQVGSLRFGRFVV
jgi:hypothetical protein